MDANIILFLALCVALAFCIVIDWRRNDVDYVERKAAANGDLCKRYVHHSGWSIKDVVYIRHDGAIRTCTIRRIFLLIDPKGAERWQFVVEYHSCNGLMNVVLEYNEAEFNQKAHRDFAAAMKNK